MDIPELLDIAIDLETQISMLYSRIAERSGDPSIATRLKTLVNEELNHARAIRRNKKYYNEEYPDVFPGIMVDVNKARIELEEVKTFYSSFEPGGIPLLDGLKKILELEKGFGEIHQATSVAITEPSLKRLFIRLAGRDQSHILVLKGLIESLGGNG